MARRPQVGVGTAVIGDRPACFLCDRVILAEEQERAYERVLSDTVPARVDYAHGECAQKEGLWEVPDEEEERPRSR